MRRLVLLLLSLIGLFISIYLWWVYTSASHPMVCLGTGCDVARASRYSHLWGLPLPLFGAAMYAVLALLAVAESLGGRALNPPIRYATVAVSAAGFVGSVILSGVEAFVLHAWCEWCVASAITVTLIFLISLYSAVRPPEPPVEARALRAVRGQFVLFIIALIVGIAAFVHLASSGEIGPPKPVSVEALAQHLVRPDSHATGNLQSPVTVVEFGDFECPMCGLAQKTVERLLADYGTRIRFVFRQFPLSSVHPQAEKAAEASECAAEQGKFWEAEELFYKKQSDLSVKALKSYAGSLGLNTTQFDSCLSSGEMAARVAQDVADGKALGVEATPTFFVGNRTIVGPPNYSELTAMVNEALVRHAPQAPPASSGSAASSSGTPVSSSSASPSSSGGGLGNPFGGGALAGVQGTSSLACSPNEANIEQPTLIRTTEAKSLYEGNPKPLFVDVREPDAFAAGHIPGAVNLPVEDITQKWNSLPKDQTLIFYEAGDRGGAPNDVCAFSRAAARIMLSHGYDKAKVLVYQDGLKGWQAAGLPVSR